jgi:hypothetical protein|nr:MAG TPA: hypothetical protein [Caudoviricetes sp.]
MKIYDVTIIENNEKSWQNIVRVIVENNEHPRHKAVKWICDNGYLRKYEKQQILNIKRIY